MTLQVRGRRSGRTVRSPLGMVDLGGLDVAADASAAELERVAGSVPVFEVRAPAAGPA